MKLKHKIILGDSCQAHSHSHSPALQLVVKIRASASYKAVHAMDLEAVGCSHRAQTKNVKQLNVTVSANTNNKDNNNNGNMLPFNECLLCTWQVFYIYYFALSIHQIGIQCITCQVPCYTNSNHYNETVWQVLLFLLNMMKLS